MGIYPGGSEARRRCSLFGAGRLRKAKTGAGGAIRSVQSHACLGDVVSDHKRSYLRPAVSIDPTAGARQRPRKLSQIMLDKITSQPRKRIGKVISKFGREQMNHVDRALKLWLNLV